MEHAMHQKQYKLLLINALHVVCPCSRIVAVNPDGTLKWLVSLSGYVVGTPVIGVDGTNIYVSHNIRNSSGDYEGFITVILGSKGVVLYSELQEADRIGPYGPLANTVGTDGSDLVMWADSSSDGYASSGGTIFMLVQSQNSSGLEVKSFSNSTFTSVTKPAFLNTSMWMGGHESRLAAWIIDGGSQEELPTWRKNVQPTERNVSQRKFHTVLFTLHEKHFVNDPCLLTNCFKYSSDQCSGCIQ
jgi:hypothetical protein